MVTRICGTVQSNESRLTFTCSYTIIINTNSVIVTCDSVTRAEIIDILYKVVVCFSSITHLLCFYLKPSEISSSSDCIPNITPTEIPTMTTIPNRLVNNMSKRFIRFVFAQHFNFSTLELS